MNTLIEIAYLISSIFFVFGIKKLASPKTARTGNLYASIGMLIAIVVTLLDQHVVTYEWIIIGIVIGSAIGALMAIKVEMTGMPQMVGLLNGFGGGASTLVALSEFYKLSPGIPVNTGVAIILSLLIGGVTFTGSMIAFGKLQGLVTGKVVKYPGQHPINALLLINCYCCGCLHCIEPGFRYTGIDCHYSITDPGCTACTPDRRC